MNAAYIVLLEQQLAGLLVQCRLGVGDDKETLDGEENVLQAQVRLPVLLQCIHTNLPITTHLHNTIWPGMKQQIDLR